MKRIAIGCFTTIGLVVLVCSGIAFRPSLARRSLPSNATDVHEHYEDARFGSNFVRCLKAKIERNDFDEFATTLKLTEMYDATLHSDLGMNWGLCDEPWWTPPDSLDGVRFQRANGESCFAMASWHEGYVYFAVFAW